MNQPGRAYRHALLRAAAAAAIIAGLGDCVSGVRVPFGIVSAKANSVRDERTDGRRILTWDVAIDCRTWRFNGGIAFPDFGRGDSFIADGRIFPGGTLERGVQDNDPNAPGGIGRWVERGTMAATLMEILGGTRPAFFATWFHLLDDGSAIVADGAHPESGPMAVVGGRGRFKAAAGELSDDILGTNGSGCPNLRVTIRLSE